MAASSRHLGSGKALAIATLLAILATLAVNTLSNLIPPGGENVGEIANTLLTGVLIIPANYAFAIWGVIYLGIIAYGFYQLRPTNRRKPVIRQVNKWLITACIAQVIWIFLFTWRQFGWSILAMLGILLPLVMIYLRLDIGKAVVNRRAQWAVHIPFSIYLAWISVATIVNVASALYTGGWSGWGLSAPAWTVIMLVISVLIAATLTLQRCDVAFNLVFVWAYGAIAIKHWAIPVVGMTAIISAITLLLILGIMLLRRRPPARINRHRRREPSRIR